MNDVVEVVLNKEYVTRLLRALAETFRDNAIHTASASMANFYEGNRDLGCELYGENVAWRKAAAIVDEFKARELEGE